MKPTNLLVLAILLVAIGGHSVAQAQDSSATNPDVAETTAPSSDEAIPNSIPETPDLYEGFSKHDAPPLKLGSASDRVSELQASLNRELGGKTIDF